MSAYVVDHMTIDRIIRYVSEDHYSVWHFGRDGTAWTAEDLDQLGQRLWDMNRKAVWQRYQDRSMRGRNETYHYIEPKMPSAREALGALQSLEYQCSEGKVPSMRLYTWLQLYAGKVAERIIFDREQRESIAANYWG